MRLLSLISGGIDSPVATYLMMQKGHDIDLLHFDNRPFTDDKQYNKVLSLAKALKKFKDGGLCRRLFVVPHDVAQIQVARNAPRRLGCVLCRRMMLRVGSIIAGKEGHEALLTGESLGQVASQTLPNLQVEEEAATIPIFRPLIGLDKVDIIEVARNIGTFDLSTAPGLCCTIVPNRPATRAKHKDILIAEENLDIVAIVSKMVENTKVVNY